MAALKNAPAFFDEVKKITGGLTQVQVNTINGILAAAPHWPVSYLAYGLATAWHEARFKPQSEWGKGRGRKYGVKGKYGQIPYGRGLVQLTWDFNYEWADKELKLNGKLLKNFDLANDPVIAARILVRGMETGAFTSRKLSHYLLNEPAPREAFVRCRRIINGTDCDQKIADHALRFQDALISGGWGA